MGDNTAEERMARFQALERMERFRALETPEAAETVAPENGQGLVGRSIDKVVGGVSDALSTYAGEAYGRSGDPTAPNAYVPGEKNLKMVADVAGPVGEVAFDAAVELLPEEVTGAVGAAAGAAMDAFSNSPYGDAAQWAGDQVSSAFPETLRRLAPIAKDALDASAFAFPPTRGVSLAGNSSSKLAETMKAQRRNDAKLMLKPNRNVEGPGKTTEEGIRRKQVYHPTNYENRMIDRVADVEGVNPRRSNLHNLNALENEVDVLRNDLDDALGRSDALISAKQVDDVVLAAKAQAAKEFDLVGDSGKVADRLYDKFTDLISDKYDASGNIAPGALLDARRELDAYIKQRTTKAFNPALVGPTQTATSTIRKAINDLVNEAVPDAKVAESLSHQSDLLTARDVLMPRAAREGEEGFSRSVQKVEGDTGMAPPTTPLATVANIKSLPAVLATGVGAAGSLGARGLSNTMKKIPSAALSAAQKAVNTTKDPVLRAALIAAAQDDKEQP